MTKESFPGEPQQSIPESIAAELNLYIQTKGKKFAVREISSRFGLWETLEMDRIKEEHPEINDLKGKRKDSKLMDIFFQEMQEYGTSIPKRWKRDILRSYRIHRLSSY